MDNSVTSPVRRGPLGEKWMFVLNNWMDQEYSILDEILSTNSWPAAVGKEVGEQGTRHLQCWIDFGRRVRPTEMKLFKQRLPRLHWGDDQGRPQRSKSRVDGPTYCCKDGDFKLYNGCKRRREIIFPPMDRWWQLEILEIIKQEPDNRTIYWYWSEHGNVGKTTFCKYLSVHHDAIPLSGKGADVRNAVCTYVKDFEDFPILCVFPIPKSYNSEYLSYEAIENVKDMYFYSGKYEGGKVCGPCPHLFVFANFPPDETRMMVDRWKVTNIDN